MAERYGDSRVLAQATQRARISNDHPDIGDLTGRPISHIFASKTISIMRPTLGFIFYGSIMNKFKINPLAIAAGVLTIVAYVVNERREEERIRDAVADYLEAQESGSREEK